MTLPSPALKSWILFAGMACTATALVLNNLPAHAQSSPAPAPAPPPAAPAPGEGSAAKTAPVAPEAPLPSKPSETIPVGVAVDFPSDI